MRIKTLAVLSVLLLGACKENTPEENKNLVENEVRHFQSEIRKTVEDPERAARVSAVADQLPRLLMESADRQIALENTLKTMFIRYETTPEEFRQVLDTNRVERMVTHKAILDVRAQIGALTTDHEWAALEKARGNILKSYIINMKGRT